MNILYEKIQNKESLEDINNTITNIINSSTNYFYNNIALINYLIDYDRYDIINNIIEKCINSKKNYIFKEIIQTITINFNILKDKKLLQFIIDKNINTLNNNEKNLYFILGNACYLGNIEIIEYILNINYKLLTTYIYDESLPYIDGDFFEEFEESDPLIILYKKNYIHIIEQLCIKYNIKLDEKYLKYACYNGSLDAIKFMLDTNNELKLSTKIYNKMNLLQYTCRSINNNKFELIKYLFEELGEEILTYTDFNYYNVLADIIYSQNINTMYNILQYLLENGAHKIINANLYFYGNIIGFIVSIVNNIKYIDHKIYEDNYTIDYLINHFKKIIDLLIEFGVNINYIYNDENYDNIGLLDLMIINYNNELIPYLIEKGALINHQAFFNNIKNIIKSSYFIPTFINILNNNYYNINHIYENNETILFSILKNNKLIKELNMHLSNPALDFNLLKNDLLNINTYSVIYPIMTNSTSSILCKFKELLLFLTEKSVNIHHKNNDNKKAVDYLYDTLKNNNCNITNFQIIIDMLDDNIQETIS